MKKWMHLAALLLAALFLLAGCAGGNAQADDPTPPATTAPPDTDAPTPEPSAELSGTISTNGSTSMEKVIASLSEAFMAEHTGVVITYDPTGSGSGITAAAEGTADIGLSSRALKDGETGLDATVIALDGIAVVINGANAVGDLTLEQIAGLFTGRITNWKDVGGADAPVAVIGREAGSGTRDGFESIVGVAEACAYDQELTSTGAVITAVAANEYAVGYASLSAVGDTVKSVSVEGVACSEGTVLDGTYAIQRPFIMVTPNDREFSAAARAFIEFALSGEAGEIIAGAGAVQPR